MWTVPKVKQETQSDNILLQEFKAEASGCVEDTCICESASDITKQLNVLLKIPKNNPIPSLRSANAFRLKQGNILSSIMLNDISDFKNLIKAGAISL